MNAWDIMGIGGAIILIVAFIGLLVILLVALYKEMIKDSKKL